MKLPNSSHISSSTSHLPPSYAPLRPQRPPPTSPNLTHTINTPHPTTLYSHTQHPNTNNRNKITNTYKLLTNPTPHHSHSPASPPSTLPPNTPSPSLSITPTTTNPLLYTPHHSPQPPTSFHKIPLPTKTNPPAHQSKNLLSKSQLPTKTYFSIPTTNNKSQNKRTNNNHPSSDSTRWNAHKTR